jgi:hypothetical protein
MIEAGLEFEGENDSVMDAFADLPAPLRPVYFSHGEAVRSDADRIDDEKRLAAFVAKSKSGFFLLGSGVTYSIRIANGKPLICDSFLDVAPEVVEQFLRHMAKAKPVFGFACAPAERERRNRLTVRQGENVVQSWVGRDLQKYVPGFYWLTLLPELLAQRHAISLSAVAAVAQESVGLDGGLHLIRFYDRPEDWQKTSAVNKLCVSLPGVFNVENVTSQLSTATSFLELNSLLREWR